MSERRLRQRNVRGGNKRTHLTARMNSRDDATHRTFPPSCARLAAMQPMALRLSPVLDPSRGDVTIGRTGESHLQEGSGVLRDC